MPNYSRKPSQLEDQGDEAIELEESLETDLCMLWDMTADKDVACYLIEQDILSITKCVVEESIAPRLSVCTTKFVINGTVEWNEQVLIISKEIAIGILANLSCQDDIGNKILLDQELTTILVNLLSSDDTQTIIQIIRLLDTLIRSAKSESCISLLNTEILWKSLAFILQNSMNGKPLGLVSFH